MQLLIIVLDGDCHYLQVLTETCSVVDCKIAKGEMMSFNVLPKNLKNGRAKLWPAVAVFSAM